MRSMCVVGLAGLALASVAMPRAARAQNAGTMSVATSATMTEASDLVATLDKAGNYKTLVNLINQANLASTLQGSAHFTVFAPTDQAFARLPKEQLDSITTDSLKLKHFLLYHVISGNISANKALKLKDARTMYEGHKVTFLVKNGRLKINNAIIVQPDLKATNGLIQGIDAVLMPDKL